MFQVSAGLALANYNMTSFKVDISALKKYRKHGGYQLNEIFENYPIVASRWDLFFLLKNNYKKAIYGPITGQANWLNDKRKPMHYQLQHDFSHDFKTVTDPCYISGYWQSEKFFAGVENKIRELFVFRRPTDSANEEMERKISSCTAVSLHVRRGDYVTESDTNLFHGVCSWGYYESAMKYLLTKIPNARFFAFSDDPEWLHDNAKPQYSLEIVDINRDNKSYFDMYLMTRCQHHIIANSSFSWWAAYLGHNEKKIVVAPKPWFHGDPNGINDIYCAGWIII